MDALPQLSTPLSDFDDLSEESEEAVVYVTRDAATRGDTAREPAPRALWTLEQVLERVFEDPDALLHLDPADLDTVPNRAWSSLEENGEELFPLVYVWAHNAPLTDGEIPLLHAALAHSAYWRDPRGRRRAEDILLKLEPDLMERVLLTLPGDGNTLHMWLRVCPSAAVATRAILARQNVSLMLRAAVDATPAAMLQEVIAMAGANDLPAEAARVLLESVTDPRDEQWHRLWSIAFSDSVDSSEVFWRQFAELDITRRTDLLLACPELEEEGGRLTPSQAIAMRAFATILGTPEDAPASSATAVQAATEVLVTHSRFCSARIIEAIENRVDATATLIRVLSRTDEPNRWSTIADVLSDGVFRDAAELAFRDVDATEVEPLLLEMATSPKPDIRASVVRVLERRRDAFAATIARAQLAVEDDEEHMRRLETVIAYASSPLHALREAVSALPRTESLDDFFYLYENNISEGPTLSLQKCAQLIAHIPLLSAFDNEGWDRHFLEEFDAAPSSLDGQVRAMAFARTRNWCISQSLLARCSSDPAWSELVLDELRFGDNVAWPSVLEGASHFGEAWMLDACHIAIARGHASSALDALAELGIRAIPLMQELLESGDDAQRTPAARALLSIRVDAASEVLDTYRQGLSETDPVATIIDEGLPLLVLNVCPTNSCEAIESALGRRRAPTLPDWYASEVDLRWEDGTALSKSTQTWVEYASLSGKEELIVRYAGRLHPNSKSLLYASFRKQARWPERDLERIEFLLAEHLASPSDWNALVERVDKARDWAEFYFLTGEHLARRGDADSIGWLADWGLARPDDDTDHDALQHLGRIAEARGSTIGALVDEYLHTVIDPSPQIALRATAIAIARCHHAYLHGYAWTHAEWTAWVAHPIMRHIATRLVFESSDRRFLPSLEQHELVFRDAEGDLVSVEGDVRVAHACERTLASFAAKVEEQPFDQIGTPTDLQARLFDTVAAINSSRPLFDYDTLTATLGVHGYIPPEQQPENRYPFEAGFCRTHMPYMGVVEIFPRRSWESDTRIACIEFYLDERPIKMNALPPRIASEFGRELASLLK